MILWIVRNFTRCGIAFAVLLPLSICGGAPATAGSRADLAGRIVSELRSKKGIAVDIGCGDASLALEIARQSNLMVYGVASDRKAVESARKAIDAAGLYGTRVAAEKADPARLPYPDMCANLVICGDEFVNGKGGRNFKEIHRVLNPNGIAFVGQSSRAAKTGKKLSRALLEGWLKEAGIAKVEFLEGDGVWARIRRAPPPGSDEWTHRAHDPGKTNGSDDTAFKLPMKLQWVNKSGPGDSTSFTLAAGGRFFLMKPYHPLCPKDQVPSIRAHDAHNGVELWRREGVEDLPIDWWIQNYPVEKTCSSAVATADALYVLGGKECHVFDPETGVITKSFPIPAAVKVKEKDTWLEIAYQDGLLIGMVGPGTGRGRRVATYAKGGTIKKRPCHTVAALDAGTGEAQWVARLNVQVARTVIGQGRLFYMVEKESRLRALDLKTGREIWKGAEPCFKEPERAAALFYHKGKLWLHCWSHAKVFSAADGAYLFKTDFVGTWRNNTFKYMMLAGDVALASQALVDVKTGKTKKMLTIRNSEKCTPSTLTAGGYFIGKGLSIGDVNKDKLLALPFMKATCWTGGLVAYGMLFVTGPGCSCAHAFKGTVAFTPGVPPDADAGERLLKGPAFGQEAPAPKGPSVWATWRCDGTRSGRTQEAATAPLRKAWEAPYPASLTTLAAGGGVVVAGSVDHKLHAFDASTGKERWQYFAEGSVRIAPFLRRGRVYISDDAGWAHCVRASDGVLVWKFRAAPADDRVTAESRLISRWRAGCGVMLHEETAYVVAGLLPSEGAVICALDAKTGELKQEKRYEYKGEAKPRYLPSDGPMALGENRIFVPCDGQARPFSLESLHVGRGKARRGNRIMTVGNEIVAYSEEVPYIWHFGNYFDLRSALPIVTKDRIYMRDGRRMAADAREGFQIAAGAFGKVGARKLLFENLKKVKKGGHYRWRDGEWPLNEHRKWSAWEGEHMTAVIMAGDTLLSAGYRHAPDSSSAEKKPGPGRAGPRQYKVYATASADGKELWSAETPGEVTDLAFQGGRLFVVSRKPDTIVCFGN